MSTHVREDRPLFNLISLKRKLVRQVCFKCDRFVAEWSVIGVCHDVLCRQCLDVDHQPDESATDRCPVCHTTFDRKEDVKTNIEMQIAYDEMEDFLWKILAAESRTLHSDIENSSFREESCTRAIESNSMKDIESITLPQIDIFEQTKSNNPIYQMSASVTSEVEEIQLKEKENCKQRFCSVIVTPKTNKGKYLETSKPDSTINNFAVTKNIQHQQPNMSDVDDQKSIDGNSIVSSSSSSSSGESEEDVIEGTPDRCHVSTSLNCNGKNKNIFLTYTNLETDDDLDVLRALVHLFNIHVNTVWNEKITHLIVKTGNDGSCLRTKKYLNALLSNCYIVVLDWAKDCLSTKTLLPEMDYMPRDATGESSSMVSWRVGRGIINSPMDWTSKCILYCHDSVVNSELYTNMKDWTRKAGFVLANEMEELKSKDFKMRIILADTPRIDYPNSRLPNETEVMSWVFDYKAVTLFVDWFLECLFRYKFIVISPQFQVVQLNSVVTDYTGMEESLFEFVEQKE